ncbi:hypothetical protein Dimus_030912, partial [Dionaea muscipula]
SEKKITHSLLSSPSSPIVVATVVVDLTHPCPQLQKITHISPIVHCCRRVCFDLTHHHHHLRCVCFPAPIFSFATEKVLDTKSLPKLLEVIDSGGKLQIQDSSLMINEIGDFSSVECDLESTRRVLQATMLKQLEISEAIENLQQSKLRVSDPL